VSSVHGSIVSRRLLIEPAPVRSSTRTFSPGRTETSLPIDCSPAVSAGSSPRRLSRARAISESTCGPAQLSTGVPDGYFWYVYWYQTYDVLSGSPPGRDAVILRRLRNGNG